MIEHLTGIHETVEYNRVSQIRLYNNAEYEDYPTHWHTPIEVVMPTKNSYTALLGKEIIDLQTGDILLICPGVIHALRSPETGERIIFQAEIGILREIPEVESTLSLISPAILITPDTAPMIYEQIHQLILNISEEYNSNNSLSSPAIYSKLLEILVLIGRNYTENVKRFDTGNQKQKEYTEKFIQICNYINEHCTDDLTLDEIAHIAGFSKYHFSRLFKQFSNVTFYKYLNQKRISYAEILLADSSISITEVALRSGFSSLSAFIRMFKLIKQCTPTEFRNMYLSIR
ncbi:AraC family transcriptional regulator [[Clostridium] polysaccharolyticum]|uniref:AraC-type DNA-binding protein n=1 Tax=[Clostridium] polysaccharolyticum TaxID=29364 RepID=A0A1H9ZQB6_9FIRM|nr:AraC family transcriptional regulator [[Clostridium] polysaccharolyticum]SES83019.1 AraC-type DNA-binding protein [[Clostridium] polysaccharolyticum]